MNPQKYGFTDVGATPLPELKGTLRRLRHERTGLDLVWIDRDEENMTFAIAFETLPWDDTGVFHILEHSVLCGSDGYPVKEPFVELMKSSMNTFLNALTFPDKTMYPISSRNKKDFLNLTQVYLDAVFRPLIYSKPEIFRQEGWHYEFDEDGAPSYKGVVFNEMKGAFADPDELSRTAMQRALFPDSPYRFVSGGDPARIPDLTYERFVESHRRFYSPSNSYVFLDGAVDVDAVLELLEEGYLKHAGRTERMAPPALQPPVDGGVTEVEYELGEGEDPSRRTRIAWSRVVGTFAEREKLVAAQVLSEVLCGDNQSPLCRAILDRDLAEEVTMGVEDEIAQPVLTLEVKNLRAEDREQVESILWGELERIQKEGLDRGALEAVLANLEFKMRERDYGTWPQGLILGFSAMSSWLYGGDPAAFLEVGDLFVRLREKAEEGWFEQLIGQLLLDCPHRCQVVLIPSEKAGEARRALEQERLDRESAGWDEARRADLREIGERLTAWQESEDTPEALATLPRLELSDISPEPEARPTEVIDRDGTRLLYHDVNASGIVYLDLFFDAEGCSEEELSRLSFLTSLLGELSTEHYSGRALSDRKRLLCGKLTFGMESYRVRGGAGDCLVKLHVSFSVLEQDLPAALELVGEILTATRFEEGSAAREILRQCKLALFQSMVMGGHTAALNRACAQLTAAGVAAERLGGYEYYKWLSGHEESWDWEEMSRKLHALLRRVAGRDRMTVSVTGGSRELAGKAAEQLAAALPRAEAGPAPVKLSPWGVSREGIAIPADIAFAVVCGDLDAQGGSFTGEMALACHIVSLSYLWNVIRVQGGAYGGGMRARPNGTIFCYSYRDPGAAQSLEKYKATAAALREVCAQGVDLTGFIIGAVADSEPLLTPRLKGQAANTEYWQGRTIQERRAERRAMLEATPASLAQAADLMERAIAAGGVCVVGSRPQLDGCALDKIQTLK